MGESAARPQVCRFRPLALLLAPPDKQSGGHSRLARDLLRQPLGRAQLPDLRQLKCTMRAKLALQLNCTCAWVER
jgi:hypothetical protein